VNTPFSELYKWIRFCVIRDNNKEILPEDDLDLAVEYVIQFDAKFQGYQVVENLSGQKEITPELFTDLRRLLILKTAYLILEPQDAFSYRTAVLSKTIEGNPGILDQKDTLLRQIRELESGDGIIQSDSDICAYINQGTRLQHTLDKAAVEE